MPELVATQTIHLAGGVTIHKGQRVNKKDDYVKNAPAGLFVLADDAAKAADPVVHRAVEAATAAPGETRAVKKPAKKKASAK
jgi:hypothetical protein